MEKFRIVYLALDLVSLFFSAYCLRCQVKTYLASEETNGLRNARRALVLKFSILVVLVAQLVYVDLSLIDKTLASDVIVLGLENRTLVMIYTGINFLIHRFSKFEFLGLEFWRGKLDNKQR